MLLSAFLIYIHGLQSGFYARNLKIDLLFISIFCLFLFGTPSLIEEMPRFTDAYGHIGSAIAIQNTGNAGKLLSGISSSSYPIDYPGAFILFATILEVTNVNWLTLINFYPLFLMFFLSFVIYVIAKKIWGNFGLIAPMLFLSGAWFQSFHLSPESYAWMLYLVLLLLTVKIFNVSGGSSFKLVLLAVITAISIIISHQGTPVYLILNFSFLSILFYLFFLRNKDNKKANFNSVLFKLLVIVFLIFFIWLIFNSILKLDSMIDSLIKIISAIFESEPHIMKQTTYGTNYLTVNFLRQAVSLVITLTGFLSAFLIIISKKKKYYWLVALFSSSWVLILYPVFTTGSYIERVLMLSAFPCSLLAPYLLSIKRVTFKKIFLVIIFSVIVFGSLTLPITRNSNDSFETPSDSSLKSNEFAILYSQQIYYASYNTATFGLFDSIHLMRTRYLGVGLNDFNGTLHGSFVFDERSERFFNIYPKF